ncbi:MAG: hypothetical protein ACE5HT_14420 [Gemmatimonadales bacterium]
MVKYTVWLIFFLKAWPVSLAVAEQEPPTVPSAPGRADSLELLKRVRGTQASFERTHRHGLPQVSHSRHRCEIYIGRFCYWYDGDARWEPGPERPYVIRQRNSLLSVLDSAAARLPGDDWIVGQRVRYLWESSRTAAALEVARHCRGTRWWCLALEGLVSHVRGDFALAESTFVNALASMPRELECDWNDISFLLDAEARHMYRKLACADRQAIERRFWWLADPLYMVPGNERRTEHYSRSVVNQLLQSSDRPQQLRWGHDSRELLMRYGWPIGWEKERPPLGAVSSYARIIEHHRGGSRSFAPPSQYLADPTKIGVGTWDLNPYRPRTRYAVPYASKFRKLEHQLALFRRGDSVIVVAAFDLAHQHGSRPAGKQRDVEDSGGSAALIIAKNEFSRPTVYKGKIHQPLTAVTSIEPTMLGLELLTGQDSVAARERFWMDLPTRAPRRASISDIMILHTTDSLPASLAEATPLMSPTQWLRADSQATIFWELYDLEHGQKSVEFSLTVRKNGKAHGGVRLSWAETVNPTSSFTSHAVTIRLTPRMRGSYVVTLHASFGNGRTGMATKRIEVFR